MSALRSLTACSRVAMLLTVGGCGSSSSAEVGFTGAPWMGPATTTVVCESGDSGVGTSDTSSAQSMLTFLVDGSGIEYTEEGCTFEFSVTGDTATLSNGAITCSGASLDGSFTEVTVTSYTLTVSNGTALSGSASGMVLEDGALCTFTVTTMASR